jgi:hypothetical protein
MSNRFFKSISFKIIKIFCTQFKERSLEMSVRNMLVTFAGLIFIFNVSLLGQANAEQEKALQPSPSFTVARMVIAEGVEGKEPVGVSETFPASAERVYCFIEAANVEKDTEATFVWYYEGKEVHTFSLPLIKGLRWRTFAYKNLRGQIGNWKVEIRDSAGNSVQSISFKVE